MEYAVLVNDVKQALLLILMLSLPVVGVASVTGLVIAFLQAATQVQDQTVSFGIKLVMIIFTIALTSTWLGNELYTFTDQIFSSIAGVR